jgi:hypothetical protein
MLKIKEIRKLSIENLKTNISSSIVLSVVLMLFFAVLSSITAIESSQLVMIFIVLPFLAMPLIFATQISHAGLRDKIYPSFKIQTGFFFAYFSRTLRGAFNFMKSLIISVLVFLVLSSLLSIFGGMITSTIYPMYNEIQNQILEAISVGDLSTLNRLISENKAMLDTYSDLSNLPALFIAFIAFIALISYNSLQIYFKLKNPFLTPSFSRYVFARAKATFAPELMKTYWALNYPLYILSTIGFLSGALIGAIFTIDFNYLLAASLIGSIIFMMFFLPFYFSNMEQIYFTFEDRFDSEKKNLTEDLKKNVQRQMEEINNLEWLSDKKDEEEKK